MARIKNIVRLLEREKARFSEGTLRYCRRSTVQMQDSDFFGLTNYMALKIPRLLGDGPCVAKARCRKRAVLNSPGPPGSRRVHG